MKRLLLPLSLLHALCYLYYRNKNENIVLDLLTYGNKSGGVNNFIRTICERKEYRNVFYFRLPHVWRMVLNLFLPRVPDCKLQCAQVGGGLNVHHGWGTILLADSVGKGLNLYQNVTVGYGKDGKPTIGNNVSIYAGAVVAGKLRIGNNVRIAANTVVRHDVPDNSLVYGNPAVIVPAKTQS